MNNATRSLCLLALFAAPAISHAIAVPNLDDYSLRTGYVANFYSHERLSYDAAADQLSYSVQGPFSYSNRLCNAACAEPPTDLQFAGLLEWTAGVDEFGNVADPGSMTWIGDFGSGMQALASGRLVGIGSQGYGVGPAPFFTRYSNMQFLFDFDFLDQHVAGMGNQMVLLFEQQFTTLDASIFAHDFACGDGIQTSSFPQCSYYSTSGVVGQKVPEPSTFALSLVALGLVRFFRRRRS